MQNIKLYYLLQSFTEEEFREFGKYLRSPFLNSAKNFSDFYEILKKYYPQFDSPALEQKQVFHILYPGKRYSSGVIRNVFSDMSRLTEDFLAHLYLKENRIELNRPLMMKLKEKNLDKIFERKIDDAFEDLAELDVHDENYFKALYRLQVTRRNFLENRLHTGNSKAIYEKIPDESRNAVAYFLIVMLKEYFHLLSYRLQIEFKYELVFYDEVMNIIEADKNILENNLLIKILYHFVKLLNSERNQESDKIYFRLRPIVLNHNKFLSHEDYKNFAIELYNYTKRRRLDNVEEFVTESMDMLKYLVKTNLLLTNGYISDMDYINIASKAFYEKEYEWVEDFIYDYKPSVSPDVRENAFNYLLASLFYKQSQLPENKKLKKELLKDSHKCISLVKSEDCFYMTMIKNFHIRYYYAVEEFDNMNSAIDAYRHYLANSENLKPKTIENLRSFLNYSSRLMRLKEKFNEFKLNKLLNDVTQDVRVDYRNWLIAEIKALLNSKAKKSHRVSV